MKVILVGYLGKKNFGDDLLFKIALDRFKDIPGVDISAAVVGSNLESEYLSKYSESLTLLKFKKKIPYSLYYNYDVVFFVGGGVFFDYAKNINLLAYLKKLATNFYRIELPSALGRQFMGIGIGIGPYFSSRAKTIHSRIIKSFDYLGVRDKKSFDEARQMGVVAKALTNDLSIGLSFDKINRLKNNEVILCIRSYKHNPSFEKHINTLIRFSHYLIENGFKPHWIFLQKEKDDIAKKIQSTGQKITTWNPNNHSLNSFMALFSSAHCVISSRMHSLYISGLYQTPFIAIEVHQKLRYAAQLFSEDQLILSPTAELSEFITTFQKVENFQFSNRKLIKEKEKIDKVDKELLVILNEIN